MDKNNLPVATNIEQFILSAIFQNPNNFVSVFDIIKEEHFYNPDNKLVFSVMKQLYENNIEINYHSILDSLNSSGLIKKISTGIDYIISLNEESQTLATLEKSIEIIKDVHLKRFLFSEIEKITEAGKNFNTDVNDVISDLFDITNNISEKIKTSSFVEVEDVSASVFNEVQFARMNQGKITGIPTGFNSLDNMLNGLQSDQVIILAARPSVGKSAFVLNIAYHISYELKKNVAFFSLEMNNIQIGQRLMSLQSGVLLDRIIKGNVNASQISLIENFKNISKGVPLHFDDNASSTIGEISAKARTLHNLGQLDLIVIDYLQLISSSSTRKDINRQEVVSEISRGIKRIAKELKVPVIALSQLSRNVEKISKKENKNGPELSDLRESGSIEQDADVVLFLYSDKGDNNDTEPKDLGDQDIHLKIAKNRQGRRGTINFRFVGGEMKFYEVAGLEEGD
jgi:replicative DNA helicase